MGFEIPIDVDYFEHPKTIHLIGLLGSEADVFPLRLWRWAAQYAKSGIIPGGAPQIESALKWTGPKGKLHKALIQVRFLEKDGKTIHDWNKGIGHALFLYDAKKRKQREKYAESAGILPEECGKTSAEKGKKTHTIRNNNNNTIRDSGYDKPDAKPSGNGHPTAKGSKYDEPDYAIGILLLLSVGLSHEIADKAARQIRVKRLAELVSASSKQENPGGWVRKALESGWEVPALPDEEIYKLIQVSK